MIFEKFTDSSPRDDREKSEGKNEMLKHEEH